MHHGPDLQLRARRNYYHVQPVDVGVSHPRKGVMEGELSMLAAFCLRSVPFDLPNPIDIGRLYTLFDKDRMGMVFIQEGCVRVNTPAFKRWIRKNAHRICSSIKKRPHARRLDYAAMLAEAN